MEAGWEHCTVVVPRVYDSRLGEAEGSMPEQPLSHKCTLGISVVKKNIGVMLISCTNLP